MLFFFQERRTILTNGVIDLKIATNRLNAFSDGVFAIIITIIVLGISFPSTFDSAHLIPFFWEIFIFLQSSLVVGSFWYMHSHLLDGYEYVSINTAVANIFHLIFLALLPLFSRGIMQHPTEIFPTIGLGIIVLLAFASYSAMSMTIASYSDRSVRISSFICWPISIIIAILFAFISTYISMILYVLLPIIWWITRLWKNSKK